MSSGPLDQAFVHHHEAMNTTFSLHLLGADGDSAGSLAHMCVEKIDQLESELSRFIGNSEISRINVLSAGDTLYISESTHRCLLLAMEAAAQTHGLFDITLGERIEHRKGDKDGPLPELKGSLKIHPDSAAVTCEEEGREIDLGGVGKGFALDELMDLLNEWDLEGALLTAGASSMLAMGSVSWPVELGGESGQRIDLEGGALSASGTGIQGSHLVHPWGEEAMPEHPCERVWVMADSAAIAEVWSTALMLIAPEEFEEALAGASGIRQIYCQREGNISRVI